MSTMRFHNFGGIHQFVITTPEDLENIEKLDPARWAATSAPLRDLHCDPKFLQRIDPNGTQRVRVSQIVEARDWLFARLAKRDVITKATTDIAVAAIDDKSDAGKALRSAAGRVNREQKAADDTRITLADVRAFQGRYRELLANGDGIVPAAPIDDTQLKTFVEDVLALVDGEKDRGGDKGVSAATLDKFKESAAAYLAWKAKKTDAEVWGADTEAAAALVAALSPKVDSYFLHCELLRQENPSAQAARLSEDDLRALRVKTTADIKRYVEDAPLATPTAAGVLRLDRDLNALYAEDLRKLRDSVVKRALTSAESQDANVLTSESWKKVRETLAPFTTWLGEKPTADFEGKGESTIRGYVDGDFDARLRKLVEKDLEAAPELDAVEDLEKLLLYVRWLVELTNNFVNFSSIYAPNDVSLMEAGSLVIDGRRLDFCLKVKDRAAHRPVATESLIFLVYASLHTKEGSPAEFEIVAPLTAGERGKLRVGKRGIFLDVDDKEYDAIITELVENPISVKEAALAPFRRASRFVGEKVQQWFGSKQEAQEAALMARTESGVTAAQGSADEAAAVVGGTAPVAAPAAAPALPGAGVPKRGLDMNTLVLGGGMALAGVGAMLAGLISALTSINGWLAIFGVVFTVMLVSGISGWFKLRKRDMSLLLEANGWAVNVHMKVTARIARIFAFTPALPKEAVIDRRDLLPPAPGEGRGKRWTVFIVLLLAAAAGTYAYHVFVAPILPLPRPAHTQSRSGTAGAAAHGDAPADSPAAE